MSSHKYHVTIEDCIDEDERQYQQQRNQSYAGNDEIDVANINSNSSTNEDMSSRGSKRQAWVSCGEFIRRLLMHYLMSCSLGGNRCLGRTSSF